MANDLVGQLEQTSINIAAILDEAGTTPEHIAHKTWYITDKNEYVENLAKVGSIWGAILSKAFPCMACVQVVALVEDEAKIEIETIAVIPN